MIVGSHPESAQHVDVAVVGAGPAGATAALFLATAGASVALIDKAAPPRYKTCGGGLVRRAAAWLPEGYPLKVERSLQAASMNFLDADLSYTVRREEPLVWMVMRDQFDGQLARAAVDAGARLLAPREVKAVSQGAGGVEIETDKGPLHAGFVIAADGAGSRVAKTAGWTTRPKLAPAVECEVRVSDEVFQRFDGCARFDFDVGVTGYGWVFPKRDHLSAGIVAMGPPAGNLKHAVTEYFQRIGLGPIEHISRHGYYCPLRPRSEGLVKGRVLLVGDAAGLADPITGEGISPAILSGRLAAEAILTSAGNAPTAERQYLRTLGQRLLSDLKLARLLARWLYSAPRMRNWVFQRRGQLLCEGVTEVIAGTATYRELVLRPGNYFKLLTKGSRRTFDKPTVSS